MPTFAPPPAGVLGPCYCIGVSSPHLSETVAGGRAMPCYLIAPYCDAGIQAIWVQHQGSGVYTMDPTPQDLTVGGSPVSCTVTMTVTHFNAGGIVIEWRRAGDSSLVWKATNAEHWNPAVRTPLKLVDYDPTMGRPGQYACLYPAFCDILDEEMTTDICGCGCFGSDAVGTVVFTVTVDSMGAKDDSENCDPELADCHEAYCRSAEGTYLIVGCGGGTATANDFDAEGCSPSEGPSSIVMSVTFGDPAGIVVGLNLGGVGNFYSWGGDAGMSHCDWIFSGLAVTLSSGGVGCCENNTVTVTPMVIGNLGYPIDCQGNPVDLTRCPPRSPRCGGSSYWRLDRKFCELTEEYLYFWTLLSNSCGGLCPTNGQRCRVEIPFELVDYPLDDEEAEALGYDVYLGVTTEAECVCATVDPDLTEPECPVCTCADMTTAKEFTISGVDAVFDGTYTLVKTPGPPPDDCLWIGGNGNPLADDTYIQWISGTWTLIFPDADGTTYTASGTACDETIILSKSGGNVDFPASITVTTL